MNDSPNYIVAAHCPKTGEIRRYPLTWKCQAESHYKRLKALGYHVSLIDLRYNTDGKSDMEVAANYDIKTDDNSDVKYPFKLHSLGTKSGNKVGDYIDSAATAREAYETAVEWITKQGKYYRGIAIYEAVKLVRHSEPPIEVIDL